MTSVRAWFGCGNSQDQTLELQLGACVYVRIISSDLNIWCAAVVVGDEDGIGIGSFDDVLTSGCLYEEIHSPLHRSIFSSRSRP